MSEIDFYICVGGFFAIAYIFGLWDESRQRDAARRKHKLAREAMIDRISRGEI